MKYTPQQIQVFQTIAERWALVMHDCKDPLDFSTGLTVCDQIAVRQLIHNGDLVLESTENENYYLTQKGAVALQELTDNNQITIWSLDPKVIDEIVAELGAVPDPTIPLLTIGGTDYSVDDIKRELETGSDVGRELYATHLKLKEILASPK